MFAVTNCHEFLFLEKSGGRIIHIKVLKRNYSVLHPLLESYLETFRINPKLGSYTEPFFIRRQMAVFCGVMPLKP